MYVHVASYVYYVWHNDDVMLGVMRQEVGYCSQYMCQLARAYIQYTYIHVYYLWHNDDVMSGGEAGGGLLQPVYGSEHTCILVYYLWHHNDVIVCQHNDDVIVGGEAGGGVLQSVRGSEQEDTSGWVWQVVQSCLRWRGGRRGEEGRNKGKSDKP